MSASATVSKDVNWMAVVEQIYNSIHTDTAIFNRYGIVLASRIPGFDTGRILSPMILDLIQKRQQLQKELDVSSLDSFILDTDRGNLVYTFGKFIYLMAIVPKNVDISQFIPSMRRIISTLDKSTDKTLSLKFQTLNLDEEFEELAHQGDEEAKIDRFPIFKDLIKQLARKK